MDTIIRMKHVSKSYQLGLKSIQALKNLDLLRSAESLWQSWDEADLASPLF